MKTIKKRVMMGLAVSILIVSVGCGWLYLNTYQPGALAQQALTSVTKVQVNQTGALTSFRPEKTSLEKPAVIFYQGALVAEESYSYLAMSLAEEGYPVFVLHHPFNLPILDMEIANKVVKDEGLVNYVVGGHSLGGVVASRYAHEHSSEASLKGVFLLGSYPDKKGDISQTGKSVLSIVASQDQILNWENYEHSQQFLPKETVYQVIEGGNHSGFGDYGIQAKDGQGKVSIQEQQDQLSFLLLEWLNRLREN